jgi:hypothetical protein
MCPPSTKAAGSWISLNFLIQQKSAWLPFLLQKAVIDFGLRMNNSAEYSVGLGIFWVWQYHVTNLKPTTEVVYLFLRAHSFPNLLIYLILLQLLSAPTIALSNWGF